MHARVSLSLRHPRLRKRLRVSLSVLAPSTCFFRVLLRVLAPASTSTAPSAFQNMPYFTSDGWIQPVVNPDSFGQQGEHSPEAQAFTLMLAAAYRDWVDNGSPGKTGGARARSVPVTSLGAGMVFGAAMWAFGLV